MLDPVSAYLAFITDHAREWQRIANRCREASRQDVESQAWVIAEELARKHGSDIVVYFTESAGQSTLISHLTNHFVHFCEKKIRNSMRLDQTEADEPDRYDTIVAALSIAKADDTPSLLGDPLSILLAAESPPNRFQPSPHDTESGAYMHLLEHFDGSMQSLADSLLISVPYCYRRRKRARDICSVQPSLFTDVLHGIYLQPRSWRQYRTHWEACETDPEADTARNLALE